MQHFFFFQDKISLPQSHLCQCLHCVFINILKTYLNLIKFKVVDAFDPRGNIWYQMERTGKVSKIYLFELWRTLTASALQNLLELDEDKASKLPASTLHLSYCGIQPKSIQTKLVTNKPLKILKSYSIYEKKLHELRSHEILEFKLNWLNRRGY